MRFLYSTLIFLRIIEPKVYEPEAAYTKWDKIKDRHIWLRVKVKVLDQNMNEVEEYQFFERRYLGRFEDLSDLSKKMGNVLEDPYDSSDEYGDKFRVFEFPDKLLVV